MGRHCCSVVETMLKHFFRSDDAGDSISYYATASRMQNVTMEDDDAYPGADLANGTEDDGRSLMMAYETIPFRIEGLEEGAKLPIIGDNFTFTALPSNPWNLATSLKVDQNLNSDSLISSNSGVSGSNGNRIINCRDGRWKLY